MSALTIGRLAKSVGVNVETIRYYERRGLIAQPPAGSASSTYRSYPETDRRRLIFIKRAQALGFSLDEITGLLELQDGTNREPVREIAARRLAEIESRLTDLQRMAKTLRHLIHECEAHPGQVHRCPILDAFAPE